MNGITRREWLAAAAACALAWQGQTAAQARGPARIGWLSYIGEPDIGLTMLRDGLRDLGYAEGSSYVIVARYADGDFSRLPRLVGELAGERLNVLVSRGPSAEFAMALRGSVPVVFAYSGDPIAAGFGDSLRHPGRNMTGLTFMALELSAKRVELLKELLPKAQRIALLSNPEHKGELEEYRVTEDAARALGSRVTRYLIRSPQEFAPAFAAIEASRPDAMLVFPDSLTVARRKDIVDFATRARIPCMYGWTEFVESGGLASYGPGLNENFKDLAKFVDKLLKGASASEMPIEQVRKIGLTLNLRAANAIGLQFPPAFFARADRVIE